MRPKEKKVGSSIFEYPIFFSMEIPIPEVVHELSVDVQGDKYTCTTTCYAVPVFNYYALIMSFDMEERFFDEFGIEPIYLNQYYPVENIQSALSNMKALQTNYEWVIENAYKAFREAEWEFMIPDPDE